MQKHKEFLSRQQNHHIYPQNLLIAILVTDWSSDGKLILSIPKKKNKPESTEL